VTGNRLAHRSSAQDAAGGEFSCLTHLECGRCADRCDAQALQGACACGSPLLARYDLDAARDSLTRASLASRPADLWRYHEVLPIRAPESIVSLGEPLTPLLELPRLAAESGVATLYLKDEGRLPTGTFKARGAAVGVSRARELGARAIAMPTNGNAGAAWAAYAARAGIEALVLMPTAAQRICALECLAAGARVGTVNGLLADAGAIVSTVCSDQDWFDVSTLREPYRIEGKKTMGYEVFEQLGWRVPDVIIYPTGGGVGLIGIHKAFEECRALGLLDDGKEPRLVAVQTEACAPIVRAWSSGCAESTAWEDPGSTLAFGTLVPKPLGDFLILRSLYESEGCAVAVSESALHDAQVALGGLEGIFACPEGAATFAACRQLRSDGWIGEQDSVVLLNTGTGLKYPNSVSGRIPVIEPGDPHGIVASWTSAARA
jgi:threonine synthase